jgi:hypothetical protein
VGQGNRDKNKERGEEAQNATADQDASNAWRLIYTRHDYKYIDKKRDKIQLNYPKYKNNEKSDLLKRQTASKGLAKGHVYRNN